MDGVTEPLIVWGRKTWEFSWPDSARIGIGRIHEDGKGALSAEVTVDWDGPPAPQRVVTPSRINLLAARTVASLAKECAGRVPDADWHGILLDVVDRVVERWRTGDPLIPLHDVPARETGRWVVEPLLEHSGPTVLFAPGGTGKSLVSLVVALAVTTGSDLGLFPSTPSLEGPVAILDWEADAAEQADRMRRLARGFGIKAPRDVWYRRESAPLASSADRIAEQLAQRHVVMAVVDSKGMAAAGAPEAAEETIRLFGAVRSLEVPTLVIDHVTKAGMREDPAKRMAFGSVYTTNAARLTWSLSGAWHTNKLSLRFDPGKVNNTRRPDPFGWQVVFDGDATRVSQWSGDVGATTTRDTIASAIASSPAGTLTVRDICASTGLGDGTVRKVLSRHTDVFRRAGDGWALIGSGGDIVAFPNLPDPY